MEIKDIKTFIAKYDKGGDKAKAGDGKLTGEEVTRAKIAGYNVWDGYSEKDGMPSETDAVGTVWGGLGRKAARATDSKALRTTAQFGDLLLFPFEFSVGLIQAKNK